MYAYGEWKHISCIHKMFTGGHVRTRTYQEWRYECMKLFLLVKLVQELRNHIVMKALRLK